MDTLSNILFQFLNNIATDNNDLISLIRSYGLRNILVNEIKNISMDDYDFAKHMIEFQKIKYDVFKRELKILFEESYRKELSLVTMKGIVLADKLYYPSEVRKSKDIDLLIDISELQEMDQILRANGYYVVDEENYTNNLKSVLKYRSIQEELAHITQYHKDVKVDGQNFRIDVDLHINCFHYLPKFKIKDVNSFIFRRSEVNITEVDCSIYTLNVNDTLIHLCAHFVRHYYWDFYRFFRGQTWFQIRLDLLHEIGLYVNCTYKLINWDELLDRCYRTNQIETVYLTVYLLEQIYNNVIPQGFINSLSEIYKNKTYDNGLSTRFIRSVFEIQRQKIFHLSSHELAYEILKIMRKNINVRNLLHTSKSDLNSKHEMKKIYFNKNLIKIENEAYIKHESFYLQNKEIKGYFESNWDEKCFIGKLEAFSCKKIKLIHTYLTFSKDEDASFYDEFCERNSKNKFNNMNCITYFYECNLNNLKTNDLKYIEFNSTTDGLLRINFSVPWKDIKIYPIPRRIIDFQIAIDFINENIEEELRYIRLVIPLNIKPEYDLFHPWPTELIRLRLVD